MISHVHELFAEEFEMLDNSGAVEGVDVVVERGQVGGYGFDFGVDDLCCCCWAC